jgi:hypothetical protein
MLDLERGLSPCRIVHNASSMSILVGMYESREAEEGGQYFNHKLRFQEDDLDSILSNVHIHAPKINSSRREKLTQRKGRW